MNEDISKAISVLRASPGLSEVEVFKSLVDEGVERCRAARLVEFLPMVYCRLILRKSGARFPDTFRRSLPEGVSRERPLSSEPVWNEAMEFACKELESGVSARDLLAVAMRSAEFDAANQVLYKRAKLEDIAFTPVVLMWPEGGPDAETNH